MSVPNPSVDRQDVATILAVAAAKVQLLDEALAWRRQAPGSPGRQRQIDTLVRQREAIIATLDSLRRSLVAPMVSPPALAGLPSPRPEVGATLLDPRLDRSLDPCRVANRWWAAA